ncbi:ATP-NAD kinase-like domain-containing protein [Sporodiniella umbellata]|nr:ATP-NAD kinase-like domain-containing protein [Sporodiniella umbellata]
MVYSLKVTKGVHPVELTCDDQGLRIEGDFTASKKMKNKVVCCCINVEEGKGSDPTLLPIDFIYILYVRYLERTKAIQIQCVLPEDRADDDSSSYLYDLSYTAENEQEAKAFCEKVMQDVYREVKVHKRLLVLINPFGGQGKAKHIFEYEVRPVLEAAQCQITVKQTQRHGHAIQIAKELDVDAYDAVVTVSGDGVLHELINGFLARPDGQSVMKKLSLGLIPGGTNNSLSISILGEKRGFDPVYTAFQVVKGQSLPLDICSVTYDDHSYYSFLSQSYGMTAYADLGTESMRWMGDTRTVVGLLKEIFAGNTYGVEAAIQLVESDKQKILANHRSQKKEVLTEGAPLPPLSEPVPEDWMVVKGDISFFLASKVPLLARGMLSHPCARPDDGAMDLLLVRGSPGIAKQLDVFNKVEKGQHIHCDIVEYYKVRAFRLTPIVKPGKKSYVAIDGEHAPCKPFQIQVHPHLGSILAIQPKFIHSDI